MVGHAARNFSPRRKGTSASVCFNFLPGHSALYFYEIPISRHVRPSRFFMAFGPILQRDGLLATAVVAFREIVTCCSIWSTRAVSMSVLSDKLRLASALTTALFSDVKIRTNPHSPTLRTDRIDQLIRARAWNDAAFALVELELLAWKLRRLAYEDGEWHCSLSRQPNLPAALDDSA